MQLCETEKFLYRKEIMNRANGQPREWEKLFYSCTSDRAKNPEFIKNWKKIKHQKEKTANEIISQKMKYKWPIIIFKMLNTPSY